MAILSEPLARAGVPAESITDGFDLHAQGIVDSLGYLQLLAELEARLGCEIALDELDAEQLTVVGPFSRYVAGRCLRTPDSSR